ncbi:nucleotide pyrophosphohydrolase [Mycoplasmopsis canis]|uniref:MazG nucleotide pyrophosphohydrolase domain-containing protein n=1 Tax=Mycoplasmopsis canis TaxID=29555 RepID=UPI000624BADB|nr:MazG nucleotide pyrophosphohydrolase domain-containing protein [Mycoplasmopsis canis]AKF41424.1 nucleotide pyrophosphohydrolase [Mycoplasmopsis canis]
MKKELTIKDLQDYLYDRYKDFGNNPRLLTKLIEEVGEVAEAVAIEQNWKKPKEGVSLASELADVIHYTIAIASINNIDLTEIILEKDKEASIRYNHKINLTEFIERRK